MNSSSVIQIRTDAKLKAEAMAVADELGISLSSLIKGFLSHLTKTKQVSFAVSEKPSAYLIQAIKEAEADARRGDISPSFSSAEEAIKWLDDPNAKFVNGNKIS